jgi:ACS family allantoate permease-like MFS transporter
MALWRTYYALENRKRSKAQEAAGISEEERVRLGAINAELGMTDRSKSFVFRFRDLTKWKANYSTENPHFRYEL